MPTLKEQHAELLLKTEELKSLFDKHQTEKGLDMPATVLEEVNRRNDELTEIGKKYDELRATDEIAKAVQQRHDELNVVTRPEFSSKAAFDPSQPGSGKDQPDMRNLKSLGQMVTESKNYLPTGEKFRVSLPEFDAKTLMTTSAGFAPFVTRQPGFVEYARRRPMVQDLLPTTTINEASVKFMEETTSTNSAAAVSEGANNKPESALAFTERTVPMEVIANWIPVTRQQLKFVPQMQAVIDNRLSMFVMLAQEDEIIGGSGTTPHIQGFLTKSGVQVQAKGSDPVPDAVYKAMTLIRATGFAEPSAVIFHPNDWQDIRLLRTTDGIYIWGSPAEAGPERIWGKQIVQTTAMTENTALTGDFPLYSELFLGGGMEIYVTDSHASLFIQNTLAVLAETFACLAIYRASAFAKITGI